jgi:hypothetical protein
MCDTCIDEYYVFSGVQRSYILSETSVTFEDTGEQVSEEYAQDNHYYLGGCWYQYQPSEDSDELLFEYDANPFDHFYWHKANREDALVFGVELEMESKNRSQEEIVESLGGKIGKKYILKSDGSLSYGVELVTMPFTLEQHLSNKHVPWDRITRQVSGIARAGEGTTACGIHVHVNRRGLSALTIGKMLVFLNNDELEGLITLIAQRPSGTYCERDTSKKITDGSKKSASRYDRLNVSRNRDTIEFRLFRGNLRMERIFKNIEFCHATVMYCQQSSAQTVTQYQSFVNWLIKERGNYPHLIKFLIEKRAPGFRHLDRPVTAKNVSHNPQIKDV